MSLDRKEQKTRKVSMGITTPRTFQYTLCKTSKDALCKAEVMRPTLPDYKTLVGKTGKALSSHGPALNATLGTFKRIQTILLKAIVILINLRLKCDS